MSWTSGKPYILRILGAISRMQLTGIFASGDRIDVGPRAKEDALNAKEYAHRQSSRLTLTLMIAAAKSV